jgi:hypothetical protein
MGEYYIPFQQPNDPNGIADNLSEAIYPGGYGHWAARLPNIVYLSLDSTVKTTRLTAIHYTPENRLPWGDWISDYGKIGFYFAASFDMTAMTVIGFDWLAYDRMGTYGMSPILRGVSQFIIEDENNRHAWVTFNHSINTKESTSFQTLRFGKSDFTVDPDFQWSKVKSWIFEVGGTFGTILPNTGGYDVWIDGGPFVNIVTTLPTITITCQDIQGKSISGKSSQWAVTGGTSETVSIPKINTPVSPGEYTVTILSNDFIKWKFSDDTESVSSSVVFTLYSGDNFSAKAIFQSGTIPGDNDTSINWPLIATVTAGLAVGGTGIYYLVKRKKGK